MTSKVAIIDFDGSDPDSFRQALRLIGGIDDINTPGRNVVIKVGVYNHRILNGQHSSISVVDAIINSFDEAPKIFLVESDNYQGKGLERLQIWKELFTERVIPFNLSDDTDTRKFEVAGEEINLSQDLSHILFKPNVFVDTHIMRSYGKGSILKNLFGCIPTSKKAKFHKDEIFYPLLADIYEAIGGIDLSVLDGTFFYRKTTSDRVRMNKLLVGRDAVAVETVGASLVGLNPEKMSVIQEFVKRGLGEGDLDKIEIVRASFESLKKKFSSAIKNLEE